MCLYCGMDNLMALEILKTIKKGECISKQAIINEVISMSSFIDFLPTSKSCSSKWLFSVNENRAFSHFAFNYVSYLFLIYKSSMQACKNLVLS